MRPNQTEWFELESYFRSLAVKWCQMILDLYGKNEEVTQEEELLRVADSPDLFRKIWCQRFDVEDANALQLRIFGMNRLCSGLVEPSSKDSLVFTKNELKVTKRLRRRYGHSYHIISTDVEDEFMGEAYELSRPGAQC